jgi:hypothetical protein
VAPPLFQEMLRSSRPSKPVWITTLIGQGLCDEKGRQSMGIDWRRGGGDAWGASGRSVHPRWGGVNTANQTRSGSGGAGINSGGNYLARRCADLKLKTGRSFGVRDTNFSPPPAAPGKSRVRPPAPRRGKN